MKAWPGLLGWADPSCRPNLAWCDGPITPGTPGSLEAGLALAVSDTDLLGPSHW